jgi:hypothetical protein
MQKAESTIGTEKRLGVCILKKKLRRCRTLSRGASRRFTEGFIDTWAECSVRDESSWGGTRTSVFTAL